MSTDYARIVDWGTHPMNGERVEVVRRDPFKRFVIVRVLRTRGEYRKGSELRMLPKNLADASDDKDESPNDWGCGNFNARQNP